jgi:putative flippase GtrA
VGASGIVVNEVAMAIAVSGFGIGYVVGAVLATQCSTLWNCALVDFWAFKGSSHRNQRWQRWIMLIMLNNAANVATIPLLVFLTSVLGINYLISNLATIVLVVVVRFALAERIWAPARADAAAYA